MSYTETLKTITQLILSYPEIRRIGHLEEVQELRDRLSEELFHFGEAYAHIRSTAERAEANYKSCLQNKTKYWKSKYGNKHGTGSLAETEAALECEDLLTELNNRREDYYLAQSMYNQTEQILNSISSRLKLGSRHE